MEWSIVPKVKTSNKSKPIQAPVPTIETNLKQLLLGFMQLFQMNFIE